MSNLLTSQKECFAQLDEMLSETDKKAIAEAEDIIEYNFTFGLWIRNNWLYDRSEEELESLSKAFGIDGMHKVSGMLCFLEILKRIMLNSDFFCLTLHPKSRKYEN